MHTLRMRRTLQDSSCRSKEKYAVVYELCEDVENSPEPEDGKKIYIRKDVHIADDDLYPYLLNELKCNLLLSATNIPFFLFLRDYEINPRKLSLLFDKVPRSMVEWFETHPSAEDERVALIQIITALIILSTKEIIHGDLYPTNILLMPSSRENIELAGCAIPVRGNIFCVMDFGLATIGKVKISAPTRYMRTFPAHVPPFNIHVTEYREVYKIDAAAVLISTFYLTKNTATKELMKKLYAELRFARVDSFISLIRFLLGVLHQLDRDIPIFDCADDGREVFDAKWRLEKVLDAHI